MLKNFHYVLNFDYFECDKFEMFHINWLARFIIFLSNIDN